MSAAVNENQFSIKKIIIFDDVDVAGITFSTYMKNYNIKIYAEQFKFSPQNIKEKVALIFFSSGTTGLPKGVQITEQNLMVSNAIHL